MLERLRELYRSQALFSQHVGTTRLKQSRDQLLQLNTPTALHTCSLEQSQQYLLFLCTRHDDIISLSFVLLCRVLGVRVRIFSRSLSLSPLSLCCRFGSKVIGLEFGTVVFPLAIQVRLKNYPILCQINGRLAYYMVCQLRLSSPCALRLITSCCFRAGHGADN